MKNLAFNDLLQLNETHRNEEWEQLFLKGILSEEISLLSPEPQKGPDGWPYLLVKTGQGSTEPFKKVVSWLTDRGIGLAVNTHKQLPDYIFTYGMLWSYREYGSFLGTAKGQDRSQADYTDDQSLLVGPPSEQYLPPYVRVILRQFFKDQGIENVKLLVAHTDKFTDLCISLESLGNPPEKEHPGIAGALSWFLPQDYTLVLTSEKNWKEFYDL